eukprot:2440238-Pyramimonas_sp.AAC.1
MGTHHVKALHHVMEDGTSVVADEAPHFLLQSVNESRGRGCVAASSAPHLVAIMLSLPPGRQPSTCFPPNSYESMAKHNQPVAAIWLLRETDHLTIQAVLEKQ